MNRPDAHILDEWIFDYLEGNLGAEERQQLEALMEKDAGVKAEFQAWKGTFVPAAPIAFPGKAALQQGVGGAGAGLSAKGLGSLGMSGKAMLLVLLGIGLLSTVLLLSLGSGREEQPELRRQDMLPAEVIPFLPDSLVEKADTLDHPRTSMQTDGTENKSVKPPVQKILAQAPKIKLDTLPKDSGREVPVDPMPLFEKLATKPFPSLQIRLADSLPTRQIHLDSILQKIRDFDPRKKIQAPPLNEDAF